MPLVFRAEMKERQNLSLCGRLKVNQHIPAANQVELGEGRILDDIVRREDHQLSDFRADLIAVALLEEICRDRRSGLTSATWASL